MDDVYEKRTNRYEALFYEQMPRSLRPYTCRLVATSKSGDSGFAQHTSQLVLERLRLRYYAELKLSFTPIHPLYTEKFAGRVAKCRGSLTESHGFRVHSAVVPHRVIERREGYRMSYQETYHLLREVVGDAADGFIALLVYLRNAKTQANCEIFGADLLLFTSGAGPCVRLIDFAFSRVYCEFADRFEESLDNVIACIAGRDQKA